MAKARARARAKRDKLPPVIKVKDLEKQLGRSMPEQLGGALLMGDLSILLKHLTDAADVVKRMLGRV